MGKASHRTLILFSGGAWLAIGLFLLQTGLNLLGKAGVPARFFEKHSSPLFELVTPFTGSLETATVVIIALALFIGYFKARFVFAKTVKRVVERIASLPNPAQVTQVYGKGYLILIAGMISLGMALRYFGVPDDIRGFVDVAVGCALINGGLSYVRCAFTPKTEAEPCKQ